MSSEAEKQIHTKSSALEVARRRALPENERLAHEDRIRCAILPYVRELTGQWTDSCELAKQISEKTGLGDITEGDIYNCLLKS